MQGEQGRREQQGGDVKVRQQAPLQRAVEVLANVQNGFIPSDRKMGEGMLDAAVFDFYLFHTM